MTALAVMEVDEEGQPSPIQSEGTAPAEPGVLAKVIPNRFAPFGSPARQAYLDSFLDNVVMDAPGWRMAFNERWREFHPGHPMFTESDREKIRQFQELWQQGVNHSFHKMRVCWQFRIRSATPIHHQLQHLLQ